MLQKIKLKLQELQERSKFWFWTFTLLPFLVAFFLGSKNCLLAWVVLNKVYNTISDSLLISYFTSIVVIIPIIEEILKSISFIGYKYLRKEKNPIDLNRKRIYCVIAAYGFQVAEAFYYQSLGEKNFYLRFIFPSHIVFTLGASYCLILGILIHMLWNGLALLNIDLLQIIFLILLYCCIIAYFYFKRTDYKLIFQKNQPT